MNKPSSAFSQRKVYRFNRFYRWYHFALGAASLGAAVAIHEFLILSIGAALLAAFAISRPLVTTVSVDQSSVTVKSMFGERSLQRSSITGVETVSGPLLMFWTNSKAKDGLAIAVSLFAFDDEWDEWLSTYRDLSGSKSLTLFPPGQQ